MDIEEDDDPRINVKNKKKDAFDAEPDFDAPPPSKFLYINILYFYLVIFICLFMLSVVTPELPYVYELFSVMIHRGSSMGGHYYAYVKVIIFSEINLFIRFINDFL